MSAHDCAVPSGSYSAFLFDMDGTVINSIASAERVWGAWAQRHGLDVARFLPTIHGARSVDTIANLKLPGVDPVAEARGITEAEILEVEGIVEIPGAIAFLATLANSQWAIVTSAPRELAIHRLQAAGVPLPDVLVSAEDVRHGKPDPEGYRLAAQKLGVDIRQCLVFEDAPVGIAAGVAAGAEVLVISATHSHVMDTPHHATLHYEELRASTDAQGFIRLSRG